MSDIKYIDLDGLSHYHTKETLENDNKYVAKEAGKGLMTDEEKTKLTGIETGAEVNVIEDVVVNGVAATKSGKTASVTIETGAIDTISVNNVPQTIDSKKNVNITVPSIPEYTIAEQTIAETGYAKTYYLTKNGTQVGSKINIPKDLVVESGTVEIVTTADEPYEGAVVGDKYIDLVIANATNQHIYIPVKDLVDVYTAGNGIDVSASNVVSIKLDNSNLNGLATTSNGLKLDVATTSAAGAMSSTDKTKLNAFSNASDYVKFTDLVAITNAEIDTIFED